MASHALATAEHTRDQPHQENDGDLLRVNGTPSIHANANRISIGNIDNGH